MDCGTCGRSLADTAKFCGTCGTAVVRDQPALAGKRPADGSAGNSAQATFPDSGHGPSEHSDGQAWGAPSRNVSTPFFLAVTGLAVVLGAQELAYSFADGLGSAKPVLIILLLVGTGLASSAAFTTGARARAALDSQGPLTGDVLVLLVGLLGGLLGLFRFLAVLGQ